MTFVRAVANVVPWDATDFAHVALRQRLVAHTPTVATAHDHRASVAESHAASRPAHAIVAAVAGQLIRVGVLVVAVETVIVIVRVYLRLVMVVVLMLPLSLALTLALRVPSVVKVWQHGLEPDHVPVATMVALSVWIVEGIRQLVLFTFPKQDNEPPAD